jgi:D-serine deaminase-like pyridoxal phosphate-dependent protein
MELEALSHHYLPRATLYTLDNRQSDSRMPTFDRGQSATCATTQTYRHTHIIIFRGYIDICWTIPIARLTRRKRRATPRHDRLPIESNHTTFWSINTMSPTKNKQINMKIMDYIHHRKPFEHYRL